MSWLDGITQKTGYFVVDVFRAFDGQIKNNIELIYDMITSQFQSLAVLITAFYVLSVALLLMRGRISEAQKEFFASIFLLIAIVPFVFDTQLYMDSFVRPLTNTVFKVAGLVASLGESDDLLAPLRSLQDIFETYKGYAAFLEEKGTMTDIGFNMKLWAAIAILGLCLLGSGIIFFLMVLYNIFMIYIMFIIGGPCLFFLSFSKTRHIFWGWLRGTMTFSLTVIIAALILSVALFAIQGSVDELYATKGTDIFTDAYCAAVLIAILTWYALKQTGWVVSQFVGGMESASHGMTAIAGGVVRGTIGTAFAPAKWVGAKGASIGGGIAGSALKGIGSGVAGSASAIYRKMRG